jgi:hypothetical protein
MMAEQIALVIAILILTGLILEAVPYCGKGRLPLQEFGIKNKINL